MIQKPIRFLVVTAVFIIAGAGAQAQNDEWRIRNTHNSMMPNDTIAAIAPLFEDVPLLIHVGSASGDIIAMTPYGQGFVFSRSYLGGATRISAFLNSCKDTSLWIGTRAPTNCSTLHVRRCRNDSSFGFHSVPSPPLQGREIYCLRQDTDGSIWGLCRDAAQANPVDVFRCDGDSVIVLFSLRDCNTFCIDGNGVKWFFGSYAAKYDGISLDTVVTLCPAIHDALSGKQGGFILATDSGLTRYDGTTWEWGKYLKSNSGIVSDSTRCLHRDKAGILWVGTTEGVSCLDGGTWTSFTIDNSQLPNNNVRCIASDVLGHSFFGTDKGLAFYRRGGVAGTVKIADKSPSISSAYPNPFSEQVEFSLANTAEGFTNISVFDVTGRKLRTLYEGERPSALTIFTWDGKDESGRLVVPGIYSLIVTFKKGFYYKKIVRY
jgi:ligand-binding sensor domain-containing protein